MRAMMNFYFLAAKLVIKNGIFETVGFKMWAICFKRGSDEEIFFHHSIQFVVYPINFI